MVVSRKVTRNYFKRKEPLTVRPGELLEPVDFDALKEELFHKLGREVTMFDVVAYALYPKVFMDYEKVAEIYGNVSVLDTPTFFYGMRLGEEIDVEIEQGKTLMVKLVSIGEPQPDGNRVLYLEFNGQPREIVVKDESVKATVAQRVKGNRENPNHISATMPGTVIKVVVKEGDEVKKAILWQLQKR